jgi:hypothetical protein
VFVIDHAGKVVRLLDLRREPAKPGWKNILTARWPSPSDPVPMPPVRSLGSAPVVERVLAALIAHGARKEALDIGELPQQDSWRRVGLPGGFALITAAGVFVLDDWREIAKLDLAAIEDTCRLACQIDHDLNQLEQNEIAPLAREIGVLLSSNRLNQERVDLVVRAARLSVRLSELRARTSLAPPDVDARLIRDALDDAWALSRRLTAMNQQAEAINASLKALGDGIVRRITIFVAIWGFPFYVASGLAMPLSKLLVSICRANGWLAGSLPAVGQDPSAILWWATFIVLSFAGWALIQRLRVRDPLLPNASVK